MNAAAERISWTQILQGLILVAVLWVGRSVHELQVQMATVQVHLADLAEVKKDVAAMKNDLAYTRQQSAINSRRLDTLEKGR
jgi:hypothetical protein